jgi:hypothetical protein
MPKKEKKHKDKEFVVERTVEQERLAQEEKERQEQAERERVEA